MIEVADLIPLVVAHAPSVPDPVAADGLVMTARDLCRDTLCLRHSMDQVDVVSGDPLVDLYDLPSEHQVVQVFSASLEGSPLAMTTPNRLDRANPNWHSVVGSPTAFFLTEQRNQIRLYPTPQSDATMVLDLALEPLWTAKNFTDTFVDRYREVLITGALARLFRYPGCKWTNFQLSAAFDQQYSLNKRLITSRSTDAHQRGVPRTVHYGGY